MNDVLLAIVLALGAAVTAGFWLGIFMWPVGVIVNRVNLSRMGVDPASVRDEYEAQMVYDELRERGTLTMVALSQIVAFVVVTLAGILLGLPWYAAGIAGLFVGLTSYAKSA